MIYVKQEDLGRSHARVRSKGQDSNAEEEDGTPSTTSSSGEP
jgi:hypothetical protein